ncbi:hypothetical protein ACYEXS_20790 [Paenibacillus sp. MAH-36]
MLYIAFISPFRINWLYIVQRMTVFAIRPRHYIVYNATYAFNIADQPFDVTSSSSLCHSFTHAPFLTLEMPVTPLSERTSKKKTSSSEQRWKSF